MKTWISKPVAFTVFALALTVYAYFRFFGPYLPMYGKGGVGAADYGSYVFTSGDVNAAICGNEHWVGRSRTDTETVSCVGSRVFQFQVSDLPNAALVFHFTPSRIRVFDVKRFEGGYYLRNTEEEAHPGDSANASQPR